MSVYKCTFIERLKQDQLVDHTVMTKLLEWRYEFEENHRQLDIIGLEHHQPLSDHIVATHKGVGT